MPSIKDDLRRRMFEELRADLPTSVPSPLVEDLATDMTIIVGQWLDDIWRDHSVSIEVFGQPAPMVCRPSLEWLHESMKA